MKEFPYAKKQLRGHNGKLLDLTYSILITDENRRTVRYGVRIEERNGGSLIQMLGLTTKGEDLCPDGSTVSEFCDPYRLA